MEGAGFQRIVSKMTGTDPDKMFDMYDEIAPQWTSFSKGVGYPDAKVFS